MQRMMNGRRVPKTMTSSLIISFLFFASTSISSLEKQSEIAFLGADALLIDFEAFPGADGELGTEDDIPAPTCDLSCFALSSEFSSIGVDFTSGWIYQAELFPDVPPTNHFISLNPLEISLLLPVFAASIESYSVWSATLWALDFDGNVIASSEFVHPDEGNTFVLGTLAVESSSPIDRLVVRASSCDLTQFCDSILNVDNLILHFSPQSFFADGFESGNASSWSTVVP